MYHEYSEKMFKQIHKYDVLMVTDVRNKYWITSSWLLLNLFFKLTRCLKKSVTVYFLNALCIQCTKVLSFARGAT